MASVSTKDKIFTCGKFLQQRGGKFDLLIEQRVDQKLKFPVKQASALELEEISIIQ